MFTQCPQCATVYAIEPEQFLQANGQVRCGVCEATFDALERLRREPPIDGEAPRLDPELAARQGDLFTAADDLLPAPTVPSFARRRGGPLFTRHALWWLAVASLLALLLLQIALAERHRLALEPRWRGAYIGLCAVLRCELPAWREPAAFHLLSRDIGPHPSQDDAVLVSASLRNDARWAQPLPVVELLLADIDGEPVALRRFLPAEYHGGEGSPLIAPGQTATLQLELADPGKHALAFAFAFH